MLLAYYNKIYSWLSGSVKKRRHTDWKVMAICILVAATIWLFNALNNNYTTKISYPIRFEFDGNTTMPVSDLPRRIDLNVTGYGWNLLRKTLWYRVDPLYIPLENPVYTRFLTPGQLYPVFNEQLRDIKLNYVVIDTLYLNFERRIQRKVAVKIDSQSINLADNYRIMGNIRLEPDSVTFVGASSRLNALPRVVLLTVPGNNISEDYQHTVSLDYPDMPLVSLIDKEVKIEFDVAQFLRSSRRVPVTFLNFPVPPRRVVRDTTAVVSYSYFESERDQLMVDSLKVVVDYRLLSRSDSTIPPVLVKKTTNLYDLTVQPSRFRIDSLP